MIWYAVVNVSKPDGIPMVCRQLCKTEAEAQDYIQGALISSIGSFGACYQREPRPDELAQVDVNHLEVWKIEAVTHTVTCFSGGLFWLRYPSVDEEEEEEEEERDV